MINSNNNQLAVKGFTIGGYPINGYLIFDKASREAAFIDPGGFRPEIPEFIESHNLSLKHLLITHGHWDHIEGFGQFKEAFELTSYAGESEYPDADITVGHDYRIALGEHEIRCLSTPGHTANGISYYCDGNVFTGDALFAGSVGGTHGINNTRRQIKSVIEQVFTLDDNTRIYPAHGPMSTVSTERSFNPFFFKRLT